MLGTICLPLVLKLMSAADVTIEFQGDSVVFEGDELDVCVSIAGKPGSTCPSSVPIRLILRYQDGTASELDFSSSAVRGIMCVSPIGVGSDYERVSTVETIPECATEFCVRVLTIDDITVEIIEHFAVSISKSANNDLVDRIKIPEPEKQYEIIDIDSQCILFQHWFH